MASPGDVVTLPFRLGIVGDVEVEVEVGDVGTAELVVAVVHDDAVVLAITELSSIPARWSIACC
jgi:hypothetical protein